MVASKRLKKTVKSKTGVEVETIYCRRCMEMKKPNNFYSSVDDLDSNGYFSICKSCCDSIYNSYYNVEHDMAKAMLRTCRKINLRFDEGALEATIIHIKTAMDSGRNYSNILGLYKGKLSVSLKSNFSDRGEYLDLTFTEPTISLPPTEPLDDSEESFDLKQYWGENLNFDDYVFLEKEMAEWKKTHKCDTKAEETLLKEICHKQLEIRKKREESKGNSPAVLVKELQQLMVTAAIDPSKTATIGAGKSQDAFSSFIKIIEEKEPADFYKDKELFKDYDKLDFYFRKYVTRPLKNFITQSRDFNVETEEEEFEMEDLFKEIDDS